MEKCGPQLTRNKYCFVPGCTNSTVSTPEKVFLAVPDDVSRKKKWFTAARRYMPTSKTVYFCCEDHFNLEEDMENYMRFKLMGGNVFLKQGVVPHIFNCQPDRKRASSSGERSLPAKLKRRRLVDEAITEYVKNQQNIPSTTSTVANKPCTSTASNEPCASTASNEPCVSTASNEPCVSTAVREPCTITMLQPNTSEDIPETTAIRIVSDTTKIATQTQSSDVAIQVRPQFRSKYVMCNLTSKVKVKHIASSPIKLKVEKDCSTSPFLHPTVKRRLLPLTSSSSSSFDLDSSSSFVTSASETDKELEDKVVEQLKVLNATCLLIKKKPKNYTGIPDQWFPHLIDLLEAKTKISQKNLMLTFMKIKLNDAFVRLGDMFGMSSSNASKIFKKALVQIEDHLKTLIFWPSNEKIKYYLPIPFRARYNNVQSIIDCLEIQIEKPSDPVKQALTWSEYKKCNTLKYLISSTPDGFINFISIGFGGRISDSLLVQQCGYLECVPSGSSVMADRGFKDIAKLLHNKNCTLIRPPSVSASTKPTRSEVLETKRIASLRIHIERVIRRIREFEYLKPHSVINNNLISDTDMVIKIACALINLQSPIIRQE